MLFLMEVRKNKDFYGMGASESKWRHPLVLIIGWTVYSIEIYTIMLLTPGLSELDIV